MDAQELISRCKAGDQQALHLLYVQYRPRLLNICGQYTKGDDVAEDLLHDAFVVILTSLDQLRDADKLEPWMTSIVRNVGFHYRKHLHKEQAILQQMASESREQDSDPSQAHATCPPDSLSPDYDQLQSMVTQLPEGYQQVFRLSVFEGLSHQEISQLLGIAPHSSSSQLSHAKRMLQALIKQSWVLILLFITIPMVIWKLLRKTEPETKPTATARKPQKPQPEPIIETPHDKPAYVTIDKRPSHAPIRYQTEAVIQPDSVPYSRNVEGEMWNERSKVDSGQRTMDSYDNLARSSKNSPLSTVHSTPPSTWNIQLAYNGQIGQRDDYLAAASVNTQSFASASNSYIPSDYSISNWIDYSWSLNNAIPMSEVTAETRSLKEIAAQNAMINHGEMKQQYQHQLPFTIQLTLSRQLNKHLSLETGLSYSRLNSTNTTGNPAAYIQEQQRLQYLGIPLRLGWQWYRRAHLSLYSSAGAMMELPIHSTLDVNHVLDGSTTFRNKVTLDVPFQWSTTLGLGIQYNLTPHLGLYLEPSLQYFFNDGSDLKSYRTEHPLQFTLPLGLRFHW